MKIRNMLVAAATFASLGGTAGQANAPQPASAALAQFHMAEKGVERYRMLDEDVRRESRPTKNAERMTASQRKSHRKNFGIHFIGRKAVTPVADRDTARK